MYAPYPENMMESIKSRGYKSGAYGNRAKTSECR